MSNQPGIMEALDNLDKKVRSTNLYGIDTDVGIFYASPLEHIDIGLQQLVDEGIIDTGSWFCDTGAGDGRVVALSAGKYNIPSIGIEYDPSIAALASKNIKDLKSASLINEVPAIITCGDFLEDEPYKKAGVKFKDIKTFFNYLSSENDIAEKIAQKSDKGTSFILFSTLEEIDNFPGLTFQKNLRISIDNYYPSLQLPSPSFYMNVYKK
ncbi:hypothetical protein ISS05_02275 [Candidatus Woesearchaeota archaeon]|nr:hypothetical protein [Candidatus Woesearchaeota archaeon]